MIKKLQIPLILSIVACILSLLVLITSVVIVKSYTASTGDINRDGEVNISDYSMLRMDIQGHQQMSIDEHRRADINGDGYADEIDLLLIREKILQGL